MGSKMMGLQALPLAMALFLHISISASKASLSSSLSRAFLKPFQRSISNSNAILYDGTVFSMNTPSKSGKATRALKCLNLLSKRTYKAEEREQ
jgi:hypothetical protein